MENRSMVKRKTFPSYAGLHFLDPIEEVDKDIARLIELEEERQARKLIMIASESICPRPVKEALNSVFTNLYSEGLPSIRMDKEGMDDLLDYDLQMVNHRRFADRRYYKGCEYVNLVETLARKRVCDLFATHNNPKAKVKFKPEEIYANVQPLSGAIANNAIYDAFVKPGETVMGMSLTSGGHLTHGSLANRSGMFYNIISYEADPETGRIKWEDMEEKIREHKPKMIIAGYSAYPWDIDWRRFREMADLSDAILLADVSHTAGLIAAKQMNNPIEYADVVMFTTQKTLCGPRGAVILTTDVKKAKKIDLAVFPGEQSGAHQNNIAAKAVAFKIAQSEEFRELAKNIIANAKHLERSFKRLGLKIAYNGTQSHMVLVDLKAIPNDTGYTLTGEIAARILELCGIVVNKNTIPGDDNAIHPTALRFGTTWVTQRGLRRKQMEMIAELVYRILVNIKPFHWIGRVKSIGRGKIDLDVMEEVRAEVEKLERESIREIEIEWDGYPHYFGLEPGSEERRTPLFEVHRKLGASFVKRHGWRLPYVYSNVDEELNALERKAGLIDLGSVGILEISGRRAEEFLDEAGTASIVGMREGETRRTLFLDKDSIPIDDSLVIRLKERKKDWKRFMVLTHEANTDKLKLWLRSLSDAYVIFDKEDIYRKIQGPVLVQDMKERVDERKTALVLRGPRSREVLESVSRGLGAPDRGEAWEGKAFGCRFIIAHSGFGRKDESFTIITQEGDVCKVWQRIMDAGSNLGLLPVGFQARSRLRDKYGMLPLSGRKKLKGRSLVERYGSVIDFRKPYFIGQKNLLRFASFAEKKIYHYKEEKRKPRKSCLYDEHVKLAGKSAIVPFAGWLMPVSYGSIAEEHKAVRESAALFDVSHMGTIEVSGEYATQFLDFVTTNYVHLLNPGQSQYGYILDPDGSVIDDVFIYCRSRDRYLIVANAVNAEKVFSWLQAVNSMKFVVDKENPNVEIRERVNIRNLKDPSSGRDQLVDIALQGPRSLDILLELVDDADKRRIEQLGKLEFIETKIAGIRMIVSRSGYTGEEVGFEFYMHPSHAPKFWNLVLSKGKKFGIKPAALGARDSTRTEAGFPLWGHELAGEFDIFPSEAGYGFFVKLHKPFFIGRQRAVRMAKDLKKQIVRYRMDSKGGRIIKPGNPVLDTKGKMIGHVTSNVVVEGHQMGMAYVDSEYAKEGTKIGLFIHQESGELSERDKADVTKGNATILSRLRTMEEQVTKLK